MKQKKENDIKKVEKKIEEIVGKIGAEIVEGVKEAEKFVKKEIKKIEEADNKEEHKKKKTKNNNSKNIEAKKIDFNSTSKTSVFDSAQKTKEIKFSDIEKKWQKEWEDKKIFEVSENSKKKKYFILEMFPYPSSQGLHMGHALNYSIGDVFARFKRMQGFNVLYPMGYDSLGLPAENAAIKAGEHPLEYTEKAIKNYIRQQKEIGLSYDWSRIIRTHDSSYYKWDQWIFLKMLEKGLAYKKKAPVNWCHKCDTVLANEQVQGGKCWRHEDTDVEIKHLEQWFLKITDYAEELYDNVESLVQWPDKIRAMQRNWIGKSYGIDIDFNIENKNKVILVDGMHCLYDKDFKINEELLNLLISYENKKIIAINGYKEKAKKLLGRYGFEVFSLEEEKINKDSKEFFNRLLKKYNLVSEKVIYFDHKEENIKSAESIGINVLLYKNDLKEAKEFINSNLNKVWKIFTTRPDTIYGVTFMVVSAQHPKLFDLVTDKQKKPIEEFLNKLKSVSEKELGEMEKKGVFTGSYAINPLTKDKVPVYAGNFVVADYGSGMVMAVPAHDQRDWEFAKKYKIPIKEVIMPFFGEKHENEEFRKTISAVVYDKKKNKFLVIRWKSTKWISPVVGGIEEGEDAGKAAEREVLEETGYKTKFIRKLGGEFEAHFYADNKKVWRHRLDQPVLLELLDDKQEKVNEEEKKLHEAEWVFEEQALKEMTHQYNNLGLLRYLGKEQAYTGEGVLVNSQQFNRLNSKDAIEKITKYLEEKKLGLKTVNYKLRDWLISRQRYWGTPIPIVYCEKCGIQAVQEKDLPVELPKNVKFGKGNPLETAEEWKKVKCPKCSGKARRETDTMDTFANSSWYFLRYCDSKNNKEIFDKKKAEYWTPIDMYIGGAEHACLHLIYFRFYTKFLRDLGLLKYGEPAPRLFNQGMLSGEGGEKMSKSKGNVINPDEVSKKYGMDTARFFLLGLAALDKQRDWSEKGIEGSFRFMNKVMKYFETIKIGKADLLVESKLNKSIKEVSDDIENFRYNLAIIKIRDLFESFKEENSRDILEKFLKIIAPFCPHIAEEIWHKLGNKSFISLESWPVADEKKINLKLEEQEKAIDKTVGDIRNILKILEARGEKNKSKVLIFAIPKELDIYKEARDGIQRAVGLKIEVLSIQEAGKTGKKIKAIPGKPGILIE